MPDRPAKIVKQPMDHRIQARDTERLERMRNLALEDEQLVPGVEAPSPAAQAAPEAGLGAEAKPLAVKSGKTSRPGTKVAKAAKGVGAADLDHATVKHSSKTLKKKDYSIKITATLEPAMVKLMDQECFDRRLRKDSPTYTDIIRTALEGFFKATGRLAK